MPNWHESDAAYNRTMRRLDIARYICVAVALGSGGIIVFLIVYMVYGLVA